MGNFEIEALNSLEVVKTQLLLLQKKKKSHSKASPNSKISQCFAEGEENKISKSKKCSILH